MTDPAITPAEYRTLREACGLSQQDAANFHDVAIRTIAHWETGRNNVPSGAAQELRGLSATIERGVQNILTLIAEIDVKHEAPEEITLYRYRTLDDYTGSRADQEGLAWPCHNAMLGRAMLAIRRMGRTVVIAWADPASSESIPSGFDKAP
jgi:transcriptional regulator with XRE-family HTH domain